jgi:curved DNA-binding protein CbpA
MNFESKEKGPKQDINSDDFYVRLGVERGANLDAIKRAYRRLSKLYHPDVGGVEEDFKRPQEAYDALLKPNGKGANGARAQSGKASGASQQRRDNREHQEKTTNEKPYKRRAEPVFVAKWVDGLSDEDRNRYRMLNRLARGSGITAPYPEADEETLKEYTVRRKRESDEKTGSYKSNGFGERTGSSYREEFRANRYGTRGEYAHSSFGERSEKSSSRGSVGEKLTETLFKQKDSIGYWHIVDSTGYRLSNRSYKRIHILDKYIVGTNSVNFETLLDPQTAGELSRSYSQIRTENGHLIGVNSVNYEILLDSKGSELSRSYKQIKALGRSLIGVNSIDYEVLLSLSGHEVSRSYKQIKSLGKYFIGVNSIDYEVLLDSNGRELSRSFHKIIFTNNNYEGVNSSGDREKIYI